jgi:hypothetical protein
MSCFSEVVRAGQGLVPRLRRSDFFGIDSQPCRAGLGLAAGPPGLASIAILQGHSSLNLPQASRPLPRHAGLAG